MKNVRTLLTIVLLLAVVPAYAQAQKRLLLRTTLPFAFTVGNSDLPAGSYEVFLLSDKLVMLQSADLRHVAMIFFRPSQRSSDSTRAKLVFRQIEGQYFLSQIWEEGSDFNRDIRLGSRAKELLAKNRNNQQLAGVIEIRGH